MSLTIGSLCSGAGMLDEGVRAALGGRVAWHAETDPAASTVLAHRYPDVPNLGDLTTVDWTRVEPVDVATAGYPCQPDSAAGKRLSEDDHRWIFPDIARAIGVLRPRLVVLENVQGHFVRGFRTVLGSLAALGFDADWTLVRASDVGAPHRRERLFVVAWPARDADGPTRGERWLAAPHQAQGGGPWADACGPDRVRAVADTAGSRCDEPEDGRTDRKDASARSRRGESERDPLWDICARCDGDCAQPCPIWQPAAYADRDALRQQPVTERRGGSQAFARFVGEAAAHADDVKPAVEEGTDTATLVGTRLGAGAGDCSGPDSAGVAWGQYEVAIRRWEGVLGRVAPAPTETGPKGGQRLSPRFVEWMMGWPDGWVTDVPGISRNDALRICGNGVVPQQAAEALRRLMSVEQVA